MSSVGEGRRERTTQENRPIVKEEQVTVIVCLWIAATLTSLGVFIGALRGRP